MAGTEQQLDEEKKKALSSQQIARLRNNVNALLAQGEKLKAAVSTMSRQRLKEAALLLPTGQARLMSM
jgi:hypothetical protein